MEREKGRRRKTQIKTPRVEYDGSASWPNAENPFIAIVMSGRPGLSDIERLHPETLWGKYKARNLYPAHTTRQAKDLKIQRRRTEVDKKKL